MSRVLDALRFSMIGLGVGVLFVGGCTPADSEPAEAVEHSDHDHDHEHGDHDHDHDHAGHDHDHSHDHGDAEAAEVRLDVYTGVIGEIKSLPRPENNGESTKIRHVQIKDFKGADGEIPVTADGIPGMRSMTMAFPMAEGVSIDGYSVGDKVDFDFEVTWDNGRATWEVTRIEKLDPSVEIDYQNEKVDP